MAYRVDITADAEAELDAIVAYIAADSPASATNWLARFYERVETLANQPERCALAPEATFVDFPVRQLLFGNYRILYTFAEPTIYVLHVRHAARKWLPASEFKPPQ